MANQVRTKNRKQKILVSRLVLRNRLLALILLATAAKIDPRNKVDREPEMGKRRALCWHGERAALAGPVWPSLHLCGKREGAL